VWQKDGARSCTPLTCLDHVESVLWRYLNLFNKECVIVCNLARGCHSNYGRVYRVTPLRDDCSKRFDQGIEVFVVTLMREMPTKHADQTLG
jgi:hypothetical protein